MTVLFTHVKIKCSLNLEKRTCSAAGRMGTTEPDCVIFIRYYEKMPVGLGYVEIRYVESVILLNSRCYLIISCSVLESGSIHLLEIELHLYMLTLHVSLGKQDNRLDMPGDNVIDVDCMRGNIPNYV